MLSTPQLSATSTAPPLTSDAARLVACCDDPHWASTVVAAISSGIPAASHAVRALLNVCSPTWLTQPPMSWPTSAGSMPDRSTAATWTDPRRSAGCTVERPPLRRPSGERTASTMTTSVSCSSGTVPPGSESRERNAARGRCRGSYRSHDPRLSGRVDAPSPSSPDLRGRRTSVSRIVVGALVAALVAAGCSGGGSDDAGPKRDRTTTTSTAASSTTTSTTSSCPTVGTVETKDSPRPAVDQLLTDVTTATDGCTDTITFTFQPNAAPMPGYQVE